MINKSYHIVNIATIDVKDELFRIKETGDLENLIQSIQKAGLLSPVYLQRKNSNKFRIIIGFKRVNALLTLGIIKVPSFIIENDLSQLELFDIALQENLTIRKFKSSEISIILKKVNDFGCNSEKIIKKYLPLLGFGRNPKVYELYKDLYKLEKHWLQSLDNDRISIDLAYLLVSAKDSDRKLFWTVIDNLKAGKNNQREFWFLCQDIEKIENKTLEALLKSPEIEQILNNQLLTSAQKTERFKHVLWAKRYPQYMKVKQEYNSLIKKAKLPPDLNILHAPFFDGDKYHVKFEFKNEQVFIQKIELLKSVSEKGILKALLELV